MLSVLHGSAKDLKRELKKTREKYLVFELVHLRLEAFEADMGLGELVQGFLVGEQSPLQLLTLLFDFRGGALQLRLETPNAL